MTLEKTLRKIIPTGNVGRFVVAFIATILLGWLMATFSKTDKEYKASTTAGPTSIEASIKENSAAKDVKIVKASFEDHDVWGPKAYVVYYEITNHGPTTASYFVQLDFLDKDGDVLGNTGIDVDRLGVNKTNKGNVAPIDVEIANGKITDIKSVNVAMVNRS